MKLVFRHYLESLRERRELDVVLPDLLSELGYNVISRPSVGARQYGVDVAAIKRVDGERKLFLFSIKQGDLTRADWDGTPQALRSSINEIVDVYIPLRVAKPHENLKVVICLCFGGEVHESVRENLTQTINKLTDVRISFQEWNGDYLAGLLSDGVLQQQLVGRELRSSFQKSIAMLDEPAVSFKHFSKLLKGLAATGKETAQDRLTVIRQMYICLWVAYVWARDSGNLESPYRASELTILQVWDLIRDDIGGKKKVSADIGVTFAELVDLHHQIWDELYGRKILPFVQLKHAVSASFDSGVSIDVNLSLFETLGRLSLRGLWMLWRNSWGDSVPEQCAGEGLHKAEELAAQIRHLINSNPYLLCPALDEQSVDIGIALIFLSMLNGWDGFAQSYCDYMLNAFLFSYRSHGRYPISHGGYRELIRHPENATDDYRKSQTRGSSLLPILSLWASMRGETESTKALVEFVAEELKHCNMQLWLAGSDSEANIYLGSSIHGLAISNLPITVDGDEMIRLLEDECARDEFFNNMSSIKLGHWPILVMACRHHRLPLPPNLWVSLLRKVRNSGC